jgi:hypothetical protein
MDDQTLAELLPAVANHIEGAYNFQQILPPAPEIRFGGSFSVQYGDALVCMRIQTPAALLITAGVAVDVTWSDALLAHLNDINANMLMVGRLFGKEYEGEGRGKGIVLMQESLECECIEVGPSVNVIKDVCARVMGMAARVIPELCQRHNGRPPHPDAQLQIETYSI